MGTATSTDRPAIQLLAEQVAYGRTGLLTVVEGKLKRLFCLEAGELVFAASNLLEEQLDEILVQKKLLSAGHRASAKVEAAHEGKKLGLYLQENGIVEPAVLTRAAEDHARELLTSSLAANGGASFNRGTPRLDGELTVRVCCVRLVLEHVRHHPKSLDRVRVRIGPPDTRPIANPAGGKLLEGIDLDDAVTYLMEASDGKHNVAALVEDSPAPEDQTFRALYGLLLLRVLVPHQAKEEVKDVGGVTRDEALARLALAEGADHYMVLGVESSAGAEEIRRAYYTLARRFHPDRFRSGHLKDLLPKFEHYFTLVTEAYNTLAEPELRKQYDEEQSLKDTSKRDEKPEHDTAYLAQQNFLRAKALLAKRQLQAAVTFLENAIELDGNNATYHLELGLVLTGNPRRREDAEKHLVKAVELNPTSAASHVGLGQLYVRLARRDDAIRCFQQALQWEPELVEAKSALRELGVKTR